MAKADRESAPTSEKTESSRPQRGRKERLPERLPPQLATPVEQPPSGEWRYEVKFDGYRLLTRIEGGEVRLFSRDHEDWTERLKLHAQALTELNLGDSWLDGDLVLLDETGQSDMGALRDAFEIGRTVDMVYVLFDAPFLNGEDLRQTPVEERRAALRKVLKHHGGKRLRFSEAFSASEDEILESASALSLDRVVGKRQGSPYVSRRSSDWVNLKCRLRQAFVIVGFTRSQDKRNGFGALLLAVNEPSGLVYAGRVSSGLSRDEIKRLQERLSVQDASPLAKPVNPTQGRGVQWVEPDLVCEIEFTEWTASGLVRQAAVVALLEDMPANKIVREHPLPKRTRTPEPKHGGKKREVDVGGVKITHPERVIDSVSGVQKVELAQYYADIAPWILPHLKQRPVALLRAPDGIGEEQFFQKHADRLEIPHIKQLDPGLDPGHAALMEIDSLQALISAAQMGTVELHTWTATHDRIETPDLLILDLDPDPSLPWSAMLEATRMTLALLDELGLQAFLKTSGGKGMHIVVPLARGEGWDATKAFAKAISQFMTRQMPEQITATMGPKNRIGKVFVDYLRNARGASTVAAYSVRARPGLPVSVPVARAELDGLRNAQQWDVQTVLERVRGLGADPWEGFSHRQRITARMWEQLDAEKPGE
ncbi:DNA ligase D [Pseudomonas mediterranea]|jgi:bifunctional non-homologous end joining protein LigD|uniref:DNA ligase (ATP) n=1 Tax=Pseudomonas mediterranea TaxID=183795 RepID=A0AAX2DEA3_9PSED|nr:DNA ligase D [Pseudomonas mediterranea]MDU9027769.1 DNA ligase D [Pseudomonas mediterranea]UZE03453.1 DNA ligase D [Pseudomonas mediterranea]SDU60415.1 bifunctional non-homologous end joining protein LigD [Pseudomonas mediterranea]